MTQASVMATGNETEYNLELRGYCPICEKEATFAAKHRWLRGSLICRTCSGGSVPRERALALMLDQLRPYWRHLDLHESSPAQRGISVKLQRECRRYVGSHYYPDKPLGQMVGKFRNENLEAQTFSDESFDIVVSLDVMEHVFNPRKVFSEIYRTLRAGGLYISTFPIRKAQMESHKQRARLLADGTVQHLAEPEYHGNPISNKGALVTYDYGYAVHSMIWHWAPFSVSITRFHNPTAGILGEYTEVIACHKAEKKK